MNCKIHPILYQFYLRLKDTLGAEIVHRRKRTSRMAIEVIFYTDTSFVVTGRLNTLPEAEKWGFWVISTIKAIGFSSSFYRPFIPRKDARVAAMIA